MSFSRFDFLGGPQIISERPATAKERAAAGNAAEGGVVEYKHSVKPLQLLWSKFPSEFGPRYAWGTAHKLCVFSDSGKNVCSASLRTVSTLRRASFSSLLQLRSAPIASNKPLRSLDSFPFLVSCILPNQEHAALGRPDAQLCAEPAQRREVLGVVPGNSGRAARRRAAYARGLPHPRGHRRCPAAICLFFTFFQFVVVVVVVVVRGLGLERA